MRLILCLALALNACSTAAVRCDKHLQPINTPAPKIASLTTHPRLR
jgi:hypothetical protein